MNNNCLVVIEKDEITPYILDNKNLWRCGRPSPEGRPDIVLHSSAVSRKHGELRNIDGIWFYVDQNSKNGTIHNGKVIQEGLWHRKRPILLNNGDTLLFGQGEDTDVGERSVFAKYLIGDNLINWQTIDISNSKTFSVTGFHTAATYTNPAIGTAVLTTDGVVIFAANTAFIAGDLTLKCS